MNPLTTETIRAALACIPADLPRDEWARVAMALKSELGESGFDLFDDWSQGGVTYNAKATRETWRSVKAGGRIKIGTLLHMAKGYGFRLEDADTKTAPTPEQRKAQAKARAERDKREQAERDAVHQAAAKEAARLWTEAAEAGHSIAPILPAKGCRRMACGLRLAAGCWCRCGMRPASFGTCNGLRPRNPSKAQISYS